MNGGAIIVMRHCGSILALGAFAMYLAGAVRISGQATPSSYHEITMTATDLGFDPAEINVKQAEKVRLIITATDCGHEFKLNAFDVNQELKKGDPTIIEFTASKAGAFDFTSGMYCGKGHHKMKGKLVVSEP
jgi:heme/copper-type cytochrome/quinol oxidase subunit 2